MTISRIVGCSNGALKDMDVLAMLEAKVLPVAKWELLTGALDRIEKEH